MVPKGSQTGTGQLQSLRVPVQTAQEALSIGLRKQRTGMTSHAHGSIKIATAGLRAQQLDGFLQQDRNMDGLQRSLRTYRFHGQKYSMFWSGLHPEAGSVAENA